MRFVLPTVLCCALSGCVLTPTKADVIVTYPLDVALDASRGGTVDWQLTVEVPVAADPLRGTYVAVREADRGYGVLKGVRWSEPGAELIQTAIVRSLEDSARIRGVGRARVGIKSDYVLLVELRAFEADYATGSTPVAHVSLGVKLLRSSTKDVVAARIFTEKRPAAGTSGAAVVAAFERASERLLPQVRDWILDEGERDWRRKRD